MKNFLDKKNYKTKLMYIDLIFYKQTAFYVEQRFKNQIYLVTCHKYNICRSRFVLCDIIFRANTINIDRRRGRAR